MRYVCIAVIALMVGFVAGVEVETHYYVSHYGK